MNFEENRQKTPVVSCFGYLFQPRGSIISLETVQVLSVIKSNLWFLPATPQNPLMANLADSMDHRERPSSDMEFPWKVKTSSGTSPWPPFPQPMA